MAGAAGARGGEAEEKAIAAEALGGAGHARDGLARLIQEEGPTVPPPAIEKDTPSYV